YVISAVGFLGSITGGNKSVLRYSAVVLKDDQAKKVKDLKGYKFGYLKSEDASENVNKNEVLTKIGNTLNENIKPKKYNSIETEVAKLYSSKVKCIIINETDRKAYKKAQSDFEDQTRVIETYEIQIPNAAATKAKVTKEPFNVYIAGIDTYGKISEASLSDVNMVATVNPVTKQVLLTSIPRDYYIDIDGTNGKDKLTHTGRKGISCSVNSVEKLLDIEINYYVKFNFTSFINVVDAIGGVTIISPYDDFTTTKGHYLIKKGKNKLNAKKALAFVRERKSFSGGDRIRVQNQQLMIKAILKKMTSPSGILSLNKVFKSVSKSIETNMSSSEITALMNYEISTMASWDVQLYHLDGTDSRTTNLALTSTSNPNGLWVIIPNDKTVAKAKKYIAKVNENELVKINSDVKTTVNPNANK
ncbi:MAG: LCP family protein, partial [Erysipelotrichaceae bacterium]|nr:LCP family protein [Erysipelotrichaceae bacterium]